MKFNSYEIHVTITLLPHCELNLIDFFCKSESESSPKLQIKHTKENLTIAQQENFLFFQKNTEIEFHR